MKTGLTSITVRQKSISEIISIAKNAHLEAIEWGSDVHCMPEDIFALQKAYSETLGAGLKISSYGSYFRIGITDTNQFSKYCKAAEILGTDVIRIWAYNKAPGEVTNKEYELCVEQAKEISDVAQAFGITVCFEYHRGTLTQTYESAVKLINDIDRENIKLYWQPNPELTFEENNHELEAVLPFTVNIHCFKWNSNNQRLPLSDGRDEWAGYIETAKKGNVKNIILEFTADDSENNLYDDAKTLNDLI